MKNLVKRTLFGVVATALLLAPVAVARAQAPAVGLKPVAVVSFSGVDKLLADADYLAKLADFAEEFTPIKQAAAMFTVGIDKTRPIGAVMTMSGPEPDFLGFIPVTSLEQVLAVLKAQSMEAKDAGDGVYELNTGLMPVFMKEQGGWAFIAQKAEALKTLPADPAALLE